MLLSDLISNCFFEVNDVNILYFLDFQSFTGVVEPLTECLLFGLITAITLLFGVVVTPLLFGEFNDG